MSVPLFDIGADITGIYQDGIDTLIQQLGKDCTIVCDGEKATCPNCFFDAALGAGTGVYNGTGPRPFTNGKCPVCKNSGFDPATAEVRVVKKYLLQRNVKPSRVFGTANLTTPVTIARVKGYVADVQPLLAMRYAILDSGHQTAMQERYVKLSEPEYSGNIVAGRYFQMYLQKAV